EYFALHVPSDMRVRLRHRQRKLGNRFMVRYLIGAAALLAVLAPSASISSASQSSEITLRAWVPVICRASFEAATGPDSDTDGPVALGQVREFCNSAHGYTLVVRHAAAEGLGQ